MIGLLIGMKRMFTKRKCCQFNLISTKKSSSVHKELSIVLNFENQDLRLNNFFLGLIIWINKIKTFCMCFNVFK